MNCRVNLACIAVINNNAESKVLKCHLEMECVPELLRSKTTKNSGIFNIEKCDKRRTEAFET